MFPNVLTVPIHSEFGGSRMPLMSDGGPLLHEEEQMEQVLTRDVLANNETDATGGIQLIVGGGLNVFDTMGLECAGVLDASLSDISKTPTSSVSMSGLPSNTGGSSANLLFSVGSSAGASGSSSGRGRDPGKLDAHKAALKIRERRNKKGRGSRAGTTTSPGGDSTAVDISMRLLKKAVSPDIEAFHEKYAYEHTREGKAEIAEQQQREATEALEELELLMGLYTI